MQGQVRFCQARSHPLPGCTVAAMALHMDIFHTVNRVGGSGSALHNRAGTPDTGHALDQTIHGKLLVSVLKSRSALCRADPICSAVQLPAGTCVFKVHQGFTRSQTKKVPLPALDMCT